MNENNEEKIDKFFLLSNVELWLMGVIHQGNRLLSIDIGTLTHGQTDHSFEAIFEMNSIRLIEEYFFIISVNKALEWLKESKKYVKGMKEIADKFENEIPYIKEVRNMREHEIEYFKGKGRKQKNFVRSVDGSRAIVSDATSTIVNEDEYLIGGRLNVQKAISVAKEIYPEVNRLLKNEMLK